jgi:4,5-dihydroxyphthalate decarboxylase
MSAQPLTLATGDYDHVRDLGDGRVRADGIDLTWLRMEPEEIFARFAARREWEVSEYSLGLYVNGVGRGDTSLCGIPVFPSRAFRHAAFFTTRDGPQTLEELAGAQVGVAEWGQTAGVWARGVLVDHHGVSLQSIRWVQGGVNSPGRAEKAVVALPPGVLIRTETERALGALLRAGELDAVLSARRPDEAVAGPVRTVLADPQAAERAYWRACGYVPMMHLVVLRADVVARLPWGPANLQAAFEAALARSVARLSDATASHVPLPWTAGRTAQAGSAWAYGIAANRRALEDFLRYAADQGVTPRRVSVEELFPASAMQVLV